MRGGWRIGCRHPHSGAARGCSASRGQDPAPRPCGSHAAGGWARTLVVATLDLRSRPGSYSAAEMASTGAASVASGSVRTTAVVGSSILGVTRARAAAPDTAVSASADPPASGASGTAAPSPSSAAPVACCGGRTTNSGRSQRCRSFGYSKRRQRSVNLGRAASFRLRSASSGGKPRTQPRETGLGALRCVRRRPPSSRRQTPAERAPCGVSGTAAPVSGRTYAAKRCALGAGDAEELVAESLEKVQGVADHGGVLRHLAIDARFEGRSGRFLRYAVCRGGEWATGRRRGAAAAYQRSRVAGRSSAPPRLPARPPCPRSGGAA